ncbi:replication initiation factor domain-containing protein [Luteimonas fraxinea]|uniref:replication initiation factor domain-containing protein n=1 Tax=Luteimonas fraxinea TaxID=2901869 RepID=UPI001E3EBECF|nr:replication initiation factor domain-containing protein [Luteimonas fraxinea]MCD9125863.1 replication initiation factor domain-containing protein [Luteimonas fraxinea]
MLETAGAIDDRDELFADLDGAVGFSAPMVAKTVVAQFFPDMFDIGEQGRGRFYAWRFALRDVSGEHVGLIEFGGVHTIREDGTRTARVELTGAGCRIFEAASNGCDHAQRWSLLASLLGCFDARITRIDIAADDFTGKYPVAWAIEKYEAGEFDRRGQRPKARLIDDMGNKTGKTFYVGSRKSEQQLRVYEKGREKGDTESEWVRYEGEFHASARRELPLDMLIDPAPYLVGAYPLLDFVDGIGVRLRIATEEMLASCVRAVTHFRRQYGPMVNALLHASGGDEAMLARLVQGTARSKLPEWCPRPADAVQLLTAILFAPSGAPTAEPGRNHSA